MAKQLVLSVTRNDCKWTTFKVGGAGGQHRDKTDAGVRCYHEPSKASGEASDSRSQWSNRRRAFRRMAESKEFRRWIYIQTATKTLSEQEIERKVEEDMQAKNLLVEIGDGFNWVEEQLAAKSA